MKKFKIPPCQNHSLSPVRTDTNLPADYPAGDKIIRVTTGGMIWQPFTGNGKLAIINKQNTIAADMLSAVRDSIMEETHINVVFATEPTTLGLNIIVDDFDGERSLAIYPEQNEAIVNVRPLKSPRISSAKLAARARKEILRAFCFLAGAASSPAEISLMGRVEKANDLDVLREKIPDEVQMRFESYLSKLGIKLYRVVPYQQACQEGWAPQPTNNVQKAIWDKVHAIPSTPMKIEFDPKKGR